MDEETCQQTQDLTGSDDDDEVVSHKRSFRKSKMIIDDDSDEEPTGADEDHEETETADKISHEPEDNKLSDERGSQSPQHNTPGDEEINESEKLHLSFQNKDIFDAESSDDDMPAKPLNTNDNDQESDDNRDTDNEASDGDEGFDESQMDPALLMKLKKMKGAGKSGKDREKLNRKAKPSAEKMLEIYSDSQKLTRESRVNLPYHEPEAKSLDDFLARASKKRQEYAALQRPKDFLKAQIIHEKLSVTPPKLPRSKRRQKRRSGHGEESQASQKSPVDKNRSPTSNDSGVNSQELSQSLESLVESQSTQIVDDKDIDSNNDHLPDLVTGTSSQSSKLNISLNECDSAVSSAQNEQNNSEVYSQPKLSLKNIQSETTLEVSESQCDKADEDVEEQLPSLQKNESRDLFSSLSELNNTDSLVLFSSATETSNTNGNSCTIASSSVDSSLTEPQNLTVVPDSLPEDSISGTKENSIVENSLNETKTFPDQGLDSQDQSQTVSQVLDKSQKSRQRIMQKLGTLELPEAPCLKGCQDDFICLDAPLSSEATPKNPGLQKLLERMAKHSQKRVPKPAKDVDISIVEKEGEEGEKKELKLKSFTYHVQEEEAVMDESSPGAKLVLLKKQLGQDMRKKRAEALERRRQMYALENEEGFMKKTEEDELNDAEEEAEYSGSDTDGGSSDDEEEFQMQFGITNEDDDDGKDYNPLLDTEAKDDDDLEYSSNCDDKDDDDEKMHLRFDVTDDEEEQEEENNGSEEEREDSDLDDFGFGSAKKRKGKGPLVSDDDDDTRDVEESLKKGNGDVDACSLSQDLWGDDLTPLSKHLQDSQTQRRKYRSESRSPDLYSMADDNESTSGQNIDHLNDSQQSSEFYNPPSQLLDADGYLKLTHTQKPKSRISLLAQGSDEHGSGLDSFGSSMKMSPGSLFKGSQIGDEEITPSAIFKGADSQVTASAIFKGAQSQAGNDEITPSAVFGAVSQADPFGQDSMSEDAFPISQNRSSGSQNFEEKAKSLENDPFEILSDDEGSTRLKKWKKRVLSDSEDEGDEKNEASDNDNVEADSDDEDSNSKQKFTGFRQKKKGIRKDFLEEEAELSGSEYDSDENLDLAEEDDILELEEGDKDMAGVSEELLRKQVGRVHMKRMQDEDDREVMRFKEMYLQDGDLGEGGGRMRNFKWKDIDEGSQQDMFGEDSDQEQADEENDETQWRKDRMEREKFIEESQNDDDETSTFLRLGSFSRGKDKAMPLTEQVLTVKPAQPKTKLAKKGSFLTRSKDALVKIAQVAKGAFGGISGGKSKNFVFQTVGSSVDKEEEDETSKQPQTMQPPKRKAHENPKGQEHAAKKQKISELPSVPKIKRQNSVFNHLEKTK